MSDFVHVTVPALVGSGFETPPALGVPTFAGISLRPVPCAVVAQARPLLGSGSELLDEAAAAERLAAHVAVFVAGLQPRRDTIAADLLAAQRLIGDAQKLARKPDDITVGTIAAHQQLVVGMLQRQEPLPDVIDRLQRLSELDPLTAPLAHHANVRQALAALDRLIGGITGGRAELEACARKLEELLENATTARAGTIVDLQARLAAAEARARSGEGRFTQLQAGLAALLRELDTMRKGEAA